MKKIFSIFLFLTFSFLNFAFADLYEPHRIFEVGSDTEALAANSHFKLKEIMVKDLVIDVQDWYDQMPDAGLSFAAHVQERAFMNINATSHFRLGFFAGVEANGFASLDKDFFGLLAEGLDLDEDKTFELNYYADAFADAGFSFQTLIRGFGVKISPAIYVPLVYTRPTKAKAHLVTSSSGKISVEASAPVEIFTAVDMKGTFDDDDDDEEDDDDFELTGSDDEDSDDDSGEKWYDELEAAELLKNAGFDLSFEVERNFFHGFNASVFGRIPILPGKLKHKMTTNLNAYFYETNALGIIEDEDLEAHDWDYNTDDLEYSDANEKVFRPMKLGLQASYRPFGKWITLRPRFDLVMRDPYSSDWKIFPEYDLTAEFSLFDIFALSIGSGYDYRIFSQHLGIMMNFRAVEILAKVSLASTDFVNSFKYAGAGGFVGVRIGF